MFTSPSVHNESIQCWPRYVMRGPRVYGMRFHQRVFLLSKEQKFHLSCLLYPYGDIVDTHYTFMGTYVWIHITFGHFLKCSDFVDFADFSGHARLLRH